MFQWYHLLTSCNLTRGESTPWRDAFAASFLPHLFNLSLFCIYIFQVRITSISFNSWCPLNLNTHDAIQCSYLHKEHIVKPTTTLDVCVRELPGTPRRRAAAAGRWAGSFCPCSSAPSPPVRTWSSASGPQAPPPSAFQIPPSNKAAMLVHRLKDADLHPKETAVQCGLMCSSSKEISGHVMLTSTGLHI